MKIFSAKGFFRIVFFRSKEFSLKGGGDVASKTSEKTSEKIIDLIKQNPGVTIAELAVKIGITDRSIERNIKKLQQEGRLRRVGPDKGGHWEVRRHKGGG